MEPPYKNIKLDKNVPIPLYYQLKKQVLALIEDSALQPGDMLPTENELCELLDVSRPTIRQAFGELVTDGYLQRYKGKGTFVAKQKVDDRFFSKLESFNQEMLSKGLRPHTRVLRLEKLTGFSEANEKLGLALDKPLVFLSRLRSADDVPLVYVDTYLSYNQYGKLLDLNLETTSLYEALESVFKTRVSRVLREIEAVNARRREAELLSVSANKAICLVKTLAYEENSPTPVEYSVARYRGDRNKFSVEIHR